MAGTSKNDLIKDIATKTDLPESKVRQFLDITLESIHKLVDENNSLTISKFGAFKKVHRKSTLKKKIGSGETYMTKPKTVLKFYASSLTDFL